MVKLNGIDTRKGEEGTTGPTDGAWRPKCDARAVTPRRQHVIRFFRKTAARFCREGARGCEGPDLSVDFRADAGTGGSGLFSTPRRN